MPISGPSRTADCSVFDRSLITDFLMTGLQSTDVAGQKESSLRIVRQTELVGGQLSATLTREHLLLTAEFVKGDECVPFL